MKKNNTKINSGFGSAMFAIKDIQNMYENFDTKADQPKQTLQVKPKIQKNQPLKINPSKKIVITHKEEQKPKILLQQSTNTKPQPNLVQPSNNKNGYIQLTKNQTLLIQKQQQKIKLQQLKCIKITDSVYELTLLAKPIQWSYHIFAQDGKPAKQIVQNPQIKFSLNQRNIRQGSIGNCYFICSLAALTKNIQILKKRIPNYQKYTQNSQSFKVTMFESGKLVQINVANSFQNQYSKPIQNDITPLILEKAYAQLYGNYQIINMGHSIDAFRDLSGHIAEYIDMKDKLKFVKQIVEAFQNNQPMVIASKAAVKHQSISAKHSYNFLSYSNKNGNIFLQLRDPRGWTKACFNSPQYLQSQIQNGQFWIGYDDLVANFEVITVSRHIKNSHYYYKCFNSKQISPNGLKAISFQVSTPTTIGFSIHQKHKKFFDKNHQYNVLNLMICSVDKNGQLIQTIKTNFNAQQVCSITQNLEKGFYAIVGQIYPFRPNKQLYPDEVFTLSLSCTSSLQSFTEISQFKVQTALINYIQNHKRQFKPLVSQQNLHRHHGSLFGQVCILYQNLSNKQVIEQLQFQSQNIEIKEKKISLQREEIKLLTYPIGPANNCSHKCTFKSKTYYKK